MPFSQAGTADALSHDTATFSNSLEKNVFDIETHWLYESMIFNKEFDVYFGPRFCVSLMYRDEFFVLL